MASRFFLLMCGVAGLLLLSTNCRFTFTDGYSFDYQGVKTDRTESGDVESGVMEVVVENRFGNVRVERNGDKPGWTWTGSCWATDASDSSSFLEELEIVVSSSGNKQYWKVELPERDSKLRGVRSDLTINVPSSVAVSTNNRHGDTYVEKISGSVNVMSKHGDVVANELVGEVKIQNKHGDVKANAVASSCHIINEHGDVSVAGVHGPMKVIGEHGDFKVENASSTIDVRVEHGNIVASGLRDDIKFDSEHGSVRLSYAGDKFNSISGNAEHSGVKITIPQSCKPKVSVSLDHGRLSSEVGNNDKSETLIKVRAEHTNVSISYE